MSVYFIRRGLTGDVKIGSASDPVKRLKQLQTGQSAPLRLMRLFCGELQEERALHARFAHLSIAGEWFRFHPDMLGDVGLPPAPLPDFKRGNHRHGWPKSASQYEIDLHREIRDILGGAGEIARRCGAAPWLVQDWGPLESRWWAASIIMLAERGRPDITYQMFSEARAAADDEKAAIGRREAIKAGIEREAAWLKRHPHVSPWWPVMPENRRLLTAPAVLAPAQESAA